MKNPSSATCCLALGKLVNVFLHLFPWLYSGNSDDICKPALWIMPDAKPNGFKPVAACHSHLKMSVPSILGPRLLQNHM